MMVAGALVHAAAFIVFFTAFRGIDEIGPLLLLYSSICLKEVCYLVFSCLEFSAVNERSDKFADELWTLARQQSCTISWDSEATCALLEDLNSHSHSHIHSHIHNRNLSMFALYRAKPISFPLLYTRPTRVKLALQLGVYVLSILLVLIRVYLFQVNE
jgi:hypothetical protein